MRPTDALAMALLPKRVYYDREAILAAAGRARRSGRRRKALALYLRVVAVEPENTDLQRRIAPLLAQYQQPERAWKAYHQAAEALGRSGFVDRAIGVYREATRYLPRFPELWRALADLEIERSRKPDAIEILLEGKRRLRRNQRCEAIALLEEGRRLDRRHFATTYELAGLLLSDGSRARANAILEELANGVRGNRLRRLRLRQLRCSPTPAAFWRVLRSVFGIA